MVKPTYLFFSISLLPENLINLNKKANETLTTGLYLKEIFSWILKITLKREKNQEEKNQLLTYILIAEKEIMKIEENINYILNNIPKNNLGKRFKKSLLNYLEITSLLKSVLPHLNDLLAFNSEKNYLFLFANNMELRPGGGFIGSFAIIKFKDLSIETFKLYDVYDADGQLKIHIEPPDPIKKYLDQPHWFLRDSAFSPDFLENYLQAKYFLKEEMGLEKFDGAVLITTTAVENILEAFDSIYLPDYKENINKKNFYIKTQTYVEKNFFPGSTQKKTFLSSLINQILVNLENSDYEKLLMALKKSLDEKTLVIYFDQFNELQQLISKNLWSGRIIEPECINNSSNCIIDYFFPFDANLGVNKANFFVSRSFNLKIYFDKEGKINHQTSIVFKNESPPNSLLGGDYKNYFQILLPQNIDLKNILINGIEKNIEEIDIEDIGNKFKKIGFFIIIPPKKTSEIKIIYQLKQNLIKGKGLYQIAIQKQIGSFNNDLILEVYLPTNIYLLNQNFVPLVKENKIIYNSTLSTDKIFIIELILDKHK